MTKLYLADITPSQPPAIDTRDAISKELLEECIVYPYASEEATWLGMLIWLYSLDGVTVGVKGKDGAVIALKNVVQKVLQVIRADTSTVSLESVIYRNIGDSTVIELSQPTEIVSVVATDTYSLERL